MKRESNGQYAFDGRLERICVCGHTLGNHCAGSPADCLFYSLPAYEREDKPGADKPECGCQKFRERRKDTITRRIVAWEYFSNNSTWGYLAKLECGHE